MAWILDHRWASPLAAAAVGIVVVVVRCARTAMIGLFTAEAGSMLGVLVSLLGFVIAALAIVISLQDRGLVAEIVGGPSGLWNQLLTVFSNSTKVIGLFALFLFLFGAADLQHASHFMRDGYVLVYAGLLVWTGLQLAKIIYCLERVGALATAHVHSKRTGPSGSEVHGADSSGFGES